MVQQREEWWNALTHGLGAVLGLAGATVLIVAAALQGDPWRIVGVTVFGATLFLLYVTTTLVPVGTRG